MDKLTHFKCAKCLEIFEKDDDMTEEEKVLEAKEAFGEDFFEREPDPPSVCDECYEILMGKFN